MIRLTGVDKQFPGGKNALARVDLQAVRGEFLALLGHNGAGKTTLMKLLLGLTRPTSGEVRVMGRDPSAPASRALRRHIGYLPENVTLHGEMSGLAALGFFARLKGLNPSCAPGLLEQVGLAREAWERRVNTYSKGMRQRLGLAQALLGPPELLLLDEPTSGLDPVLRHTFFQILEALRSRGATILLSSHILQEVEGRCDRVLFLKLGQVTGQGSLEELRLLAGLPGQARFLPPAGERERFFALLDGRFPMVGEEGGDGVTVTFPPAEQEALLLHATGGGIPLRAIEVRLPTLEDLYRHFQLD